MNQVDMLKAIIQKAKDDNQLIATAIAAKLGDQRKYSRELQHQITDLSVALYTLGVNAGIELSLEQPEVLQAYAEMEHDEGEV